MEVETEVMETSEPGDGDVSNQQQQEQQPQPGSSGNSFKMTSLTDQLRNIAISVLASQNSAATTNTVLRVNQRRHFMYYFDRDVDAATTDPEVMKTNYRIPLRYLIEKKEGDKTIIRVSEPSLKDELIVSHRFLKSFKSLKAWECVEDLQKFRGWNRVITNPLPVIKRTLDYCLPVTFTNIKSLLDEEATSSSKGSNDPLRELSASSKAIKKKKDGGNKDKKKTAKKSNTKSGEAIVGSVGLYEVRLRSLETLLPGKDLNDEIVDFGLQKVIRSCDSPRDVLYIPSFRWQTYFYSVDHENKIARFYKWLIDSEPERDLFDINTMVIPICKDSHWLLGIVCRPFPDKKVIEEAERMAKEKGHPLNVYSLTIYHEWLYGKGNRNPAKILIFDSMQAKLQFTSTNYEEFIGDAARYIRNGLLALHRKIWKETQRDILVHPKFALMIDYHSPFIPGQEGGKDCGLFVIRYLKFWLDEMERLKGDYMSYYARDFTKIFNEKYANYVSRQMIYEIIIGWCFRYKPKLVKKVDEIVGDSFTRKGKINKK